MPVSEVTALKIENLHLKLAQLELTHQQWTKDRDALIAQARTEAGVDESARYNVQTREFDVVTIKGPRTPPMTDEVAAKRVAKRA